MLNTTAHGTGELSSQQPLVQRTKHIGLLNADSIAFYFADMDDPCIFRLTRDLTLGRHAPKASMQPTVDLTTFGAYEKGVSRLHAVIRRGRGGGIEVEDLASGNGTWLNNTRVEPHVPKPLRSGDRLTLGTLSIEIYLADTDEESVESITEEAPAPDDVLFDTLPVKVGVPAINSAVPVVPLLLPAPKTPAFTYYHASVSLGLQHTAKELGAVLAKIISQLLKLKDCEIKLTLHIDAHARTPFDESRVCAVQRMAGDLKLNESEFRPE